MATEGDFQTKAWAAPAPSEPLAAMTISRRSLKPTDVHIAIKYAGICHSDIHQVRDEWGKGTYPMVPGHEIGGFVERVGAAVTKFSVGDKVGVGCMVGSCKSCTNCGEGNEQYCDSGMVGTYNSKEKYPHMGGYNADGGAITYGGYSQDIVVDEAFVVSVPANLDLAAATPLMCAGITVYSPMAFYGLKPGMKLAVAGLGGLGHMAVKIGVAWGCNVTVLSRGTGKKEEALGVLGAHAFVDTKNEAEMAAVRGSFDFIIDTISANHDVALYMGTLRCNGKMIMVGASPDPLQISAFNLIGGRKTLAGSLIGGVKETQDMLDFCGQHNIVCEIEMITAADINVAYERTIVADVKYRFVIDTATL